MRIKRNIDGGWEVRDGELKLRLNTRSGELFNLGFNPRLPSLDDYYEPWTYKYDDLYQCSSPADQPIATPVSLVTGKEMEIEAGPNWDDDLGGSPIYAANDPNLKAFTDDERRQLFEMERIVYFYSAAYLQPLCKSELCRRLSGGRHLQARRRRHRSRQPGEVHGLAHVCLRLSV